MPLDLSNEKLDLPYPCRWAYKVIGKDEDALRSAVSEIVQAREHSVSLSRRSAERNYVSLNVEVVVHDDEDRVAIYDALKGHRAVTLVL
jgi:putative lipoic acid-binding regulatory protein